jgi:DNA-binding transcriptional MocR family regulator
MAVTPEGATDALIRQQRITGGRAAGIMAELARVWIDTGVADRTLAQIKRELAVRREVLFEVMGQRAPGCQPGAMFAWVTLPERWVPSEFAALAQARGVKITPGPAFAVDRTAPHHAVRLCIGAPPSAERLRQGLTIIDRLIDEEIDERYQAMA